MNNYFRKVGRTYFVISSLAQVTSCRIIYFCKLRKKKYLNLILCNPVLGDAVGGLTSRGREGNMDKRDSLSPVRRELLRIGTGRIPPSMPHPVLLAACEKKQTNKKPHNVYYWKRSKTAHDHSGREGSFLLPLLWGEKNVDSHQNHQLPAHRKEKSFPNIRLILAQQSLPKVMLCRSEKRKVKKGHQ